MEALRKNALIRSNSRIFFYLWSEHEGDGGEVAVADRQQAQEGDIVTLVQKQHLKIVISSNQVLNAWFTSQCQLCHICHNCHNCKVEFRTKI